MKQKEQKQNVLSTFIDVLSQNGGHIAFLMITGLITGTKVSHPLRWFFYQSMIIHRLIIIDIS